jgi:hypothetical protein
MVSFTLQPLYSGERAPGTHLIGGWEGPRAGLDVLARIKIPALAGNQILAVQSASFALKLSTNCFLGSFLW